MNQPLPRFLMIVAATLALAACDRLGLPDPAKQAAQKEEEGKAVGAACRQSSRPLEDCYAANRGSPKAAIFAGWREMNDYMAQNNIPAAKPEADTAAGDDVAASAPAASAPVADDDQSKPASRKARKKTAGSPKAAK